MKDLMIQVPTAAEIRWVSLECAVLQPRYPYAPYKNDKAPNDVIIIPRGRGASIMGPRKGLGRKTDTHGSTQYSSRSGTGFLTGYFTGIPCFLAAADTKVTDADQHGLPQRLRQLRGQGNLSQTELGVGLDLAVLRPHRANARGHSTMNRDLTESSDECMR